MAAMVAGPFGGKATLPGLREMRRDHGVAVLTLTPTLTLTLTQP